MSVLCAGVGQIARATAAVSMGAASLAFAAPAGAVTPEACAAMSLDPGCQQQANGFYAEDHHAIVCAEFARIPEIAVGQAFQQALDAVGAADPGMSLPVRGSTVGASVCLFCGEYYDALTTYLGSSQ